MSNTKASLTQQNTQTYPSNTSGSITALSVKSFNNNFINAVATLGDTNVFTQPQTFGNTVQVNSNITANNVYAGNIPYLSGSNTFTGPSNTFSGSVNIQTASIQFLTVDTIVSSSTINNTGSNQLGDSAADTQTLWGTVNLPSGPLKVTGSVSSTNGFTGSLQGTSSFANNATTASHALTAVSSSFALTASYAQNAGTTVNTGSLLVTASVSNDIITFTKGNNTTFDITVNNVKNSSTSSVISVGGDNTNASRKIVFVGTTVASVNEQLLIAANTPDLSYNPTTNVINATASFATTASFALSGGGGSTNTGSLLTTASVSLNTITFTKGDASTFAITVDTGSGGGGAIATGSFATTGSNVFSGSQTFNTASLFLNASGSSPLFTNFTQSVSGAQSYGNILMFPITTFSASVILSGSRNIGTVNPGSNAGATTNKGGGNLNGNFGLFSVSSTTASATPVLNNNFLASSISANIPNTSSVTTLTSNFVGGAITVTGSALSNVIVNFNNIDSVTIINDFTASTGANQQVSVNNNLIKGGTTTTTLAQIKFAGTGSGSNSRQFNNNIMFGSANTASLEATATANGNMLNTAIIGSNLIVSGTMASNSTAASMFVGQFNETGSLADPSQIKFAVGAGTTTTTRSTPLYVSASGDVIMRLPGQTANSIFKGDIVDINGRWNGTTNTLTNNATAIASAQAIMSQSIGSAIIATQGVSVGGAYAGSSVTGSAAIADFSGDLGGTNWVASIGNYDSSIRGTQQGLVAATSASFMSSSVNSAIIAGGNVRLNNGNSTVALGRDTAYTASAAYTLFTQNINASGSVSITGSATITGDVKFASGSNTTMGTAVLDGGNPGTVTVSNSLVTANSLIFLTKQTLNHPNGYVAVSSKGSSTFTITSNHNGDSDTVAYLIINPA